MRGVVLASFESKKWIPLDYVSTLMNIKVLEVLEAHELIEVRTGFTKPTTFRIKANGYKAVL